MLALARNDRAMNVPERGAPSWCAHLKRTAATPRFTPDDSLGVALKFANVGKRNLRFGGGARA